MEDFEDMQEKYKDKGKIVPKTVPLAADAAHLLSEYLDSITIQLVIAGIDEPYRIAQEYEEMLVQELQIKAGTSKLTYEVVAAVLEDYGTPPQIVEKYIREHNPKLIKLVPKVSRPGFQPYSRFNRFSFSAIFVTILLLLFFNLPNFVPNSSVNAEMLAVALFLFIFLEVYTGFRSTPLEPGVHQMLRQGTVFVLTLESMITTFKAFDIGTYSAVVQDWGIIVTGWTIMMLVLFVKDYTSILKTTNESPKPLARFMLPSYLAFGAALFGGTVLLLIDDNGQSRSDEMIFLFALVMSLAALSLVFELRKKYPVSLNKLGYTIILFFFLPIYYFSYYESVWFNSFTMDTESVIGSFVSWLIILVIFLPNIFKKQISEQLEAYRIDK